MSTNVFNDFKAYPVTNGNALYTNWSFDPTFLASVDTSVNPNTPQFIYIYVTDYNAVAAGNTIASPVVVPLRDASGNLTTQFSIDNSTANVTIDIKNGTRYHLMAQMVYQDSSNIIRSSNSQQSIVMCSTIPEVPNFVLTPITDAFQIQLLDASGNSPTPLSKFDGFGILKGIFVTYASGTQLFSTFIANDVSNNLYTQPQTIPVSLNTYEVSVASYNYNSAVAPNGSVVKYGGRSATSQSKLVDVDDTPGPVTDLQVYETMADFSNNMTTASTYTSVSNTIKWGLPSPLTGASAETITGYNIYRNNVKIDTITNTDPEFLTRKYVDASSVLQVNTLYHYNVTAFNPDGEGSRNGSVSITGVVFPTQTNLIVDPSGNQSLAMKVTNVANGFPLDTYRFDFSYNANDSSNNSGYQPSNPLLVTNLSNNATYNVQSSTRVPSVNASGVAYTTSYFTPVVQAVPYNPVAPSPTDMSSNPLDLSGNPSGTVVVSWFNSDVSAVGFSGQLSYTLSYKLTGAPDASYIVQDTSNCITRTRTTYTMPSGILTRGSSYTFRVFNTLTSNTGDETKIAVSPNVTTGPVVPFVVPGAVRSLALTNPTTNDMSYSWLPPSSTGGLPLAQYRATLRLLNDGSNVLVNSVTTSDISGNLSTLFGQLTQGSQYRLIVQASVDGSFGATGQNFTGPDASATNFTVPQGLDSPNVTNINNGSLLNGIQINWGSNPQYLALDGSNVTFNIYRSGSVNPTFTRITGTSFLDASAIIGVSNYYQVVPVVNDVSGVYIRNSTPVPSQSITRIRVPAQPTNLGVISRTSTSIDFSWNASSGGSGNDASLNYLWTLTDASGNIDASGVTTLNRASAVNLDTAGLYTIQVRAGVVNPSNNITYYNNTSVPQLTAALYNTPPAAGFITVYGSQAVSSDGALLVNLTDASSVVGLQFSSYTIQVATDPSFITGLKTISSSSSEFYISGLTNGTLYYVRGTNVYKDIQNNNVSSPVSQTATGTPTISPAQPSGVLANTEAESSVTVYWNIPNDNPTSYAVNYSTDPSNLIPSDVTFLPTSDFSANATQYYKTITNLNYGVVYYINVIAGIQSSGSVAVSQPSATVTAVPYTTPTAPQNFNNIPGDTSIVSNWNAPSNTGGAGVGLNGTLLYQIQLSTDPSFSRFVTDVSGVSQNTYTFSGLITNTIYNTRVRAYFAIQGNANNLSYGPYATQLNIQTQSPPVDPVITLVTGDNSLGLNGSQQGRTILVNYTIDPTKQASLALKRQVLDPTGTNVLDNYRVVMTRNVAPSNISSGQFIDTSANPGSANFLNGNMMQYKLDVSYVIIGGSPYVKETDPSLMATPYDSPIATDASGNPIDLSNCIVPINPDASGAYTSFTLRINKNGSDLNSIVAVGLPNSGEQAYVIQQTKTQSPLINVTYSNVQVDGKIAANQYGEYVMSYGTGNKVNNTLVLESNAGGTLLAKQPNNGAFGPNQI